MKNMSMKMTKSTTQPLKTIMFCTTSFLFKAVLLTRFVRHYNKNKNSDRPAIHLGIGQADDDPLDLTNFWASIEGFFEFGHPSVQCSYFSS